MKKYLILMLAAVAALVSCVENTLVPENEEKTPVTFNLSARYPGDTKAVKTGWENGDVIFVFFSGIAENYLKMSYADGSWTATEMTGRVEGPIGLTDGQTGTMRAIFLPFGNDAMPYWDSNEPGCFRFNKQCPYYFMTDTRSFKVVGNTVTGIFNMEIFDDDDTHYVQFFIEDADAHENGLSVQTDAINVMMLSSISADGTITLNGSYAGEPIPGYVYGTGSAKGYLFSGTINQNYNFKITGDSQYSGTHNFGGYYFAKTDDGGNRADYFITGKTLTSQMAFKLPSNSSDKWQPVGSDKTVSLKKGDTDLGKWYTCNYLCSKPEEVGESYTYEEIFHIANVHYPSKDDYSSIIDNCTWLTASVGGHKGWVAQSDTGFLFFPQSSENDNGAWYVFLWTETFSRIDEGTSAFWQYVFNTSYIDSQINVTEYPHKIGDQELKFPIRLRPES